MNVNDAVQEMLAYLELSAKAIDAVWSEYPEEEETKGMNDAIFKAHEHADGSYLTMMELEEAMEELTEGFPNFHPAATDNLFPNDGYQKVKGLKNTMPQIFEADPKYMQLCPLPDDECQHMENQHPWPLVDIMIHLNDHHEWSRHAIADWLETLDVDLKFEVPEGGDE